MKQLLMTTTAALLLAAPAFAESHVDAAASADAEVTAGETSVGASMDAAAEATTDAVDVAADAVADAAASTADAVTGSATTVAASVSADPMIVVDGYSNVAVDITAEALLGLTVMNTADESLGDISDIVLNEDGTIDAVILDVGGFLGIGAKPVSVDFETLTILQADEGTDLRVYMDASADSLEAMPAYEA